jgi:hypothetical protein
LIFAGLISAAVIHTVSFQKGVALFPLLPLW